MRQLSPPTCCAMMCEQPVSPGYSKSFIAMRGDETTRHSTANEVHANKASDSWNCWFKRPVADLRMNDTPHMYVHLCSCVLLSLDNGGNGGECRGFSSQPCRNDTKTLQAEELDEQPSPCDMSTYSISILSHARSCEMSLSQCSQALYSSVDVARS